MGTLAVASQGFSWGMPLSLVYWSVDAIKCLIYGLQLRVTDSAVGPPPELRSEVTSESFRKSQKIMRVICYTSIFGIFFRNVVRTFKIASGFFPWTYHLFERFAETPALKLAMFSFGDTLMSRLMLLPFAMMMSTLAPIREPLTLAEVIFTSLLQIGILASASWVATYCFIATVENYGVHSVLWLCPLMNIIGIMTVAFYVHVMVPILYQPVPEGPLRNSISLVAARVGFPIGQIYVMPTGLLNAEPRPNAFYTGVFGTKMIFLSENLVTELSTDEVTSVVAHELGHWAGYHTLIYLCVSAFEMGAYCAVVIHSYNNDWLLSTFGASGLKAHPALSCILALSYIWPTIKEVASGLQSTVGRFCEFAADDYARKLGFRRPLISALIKLSKYNGFPYASPMYSSWFVGHPTIIERVRRCASR